MQRLKVKFESQNRQTSVKFSCEYWSIDLNLDRVHSYKSSLGIDRMSPGLRLASMRHVCIESLLTS